MTHAADFTKSAQTHAAAARAAYIDAARQMIARLACTA